MTEKSKNMEQQADFAHHQSRWQEIGRKSKELTKSRISLVTRLKAGNRETAAELVDLYYEQIYLYMRRLGHSSQVSEDLTQESFLQAWQHIGQLRKDKALNSWLYRIANNVSRLYWRRHKGKEQGSIEGFEVSDGGQGRERIADFEELEQLNRAVGTLPAKFREVIVLHYMQHLSINEAAEAADLRKGTFKSRLNRALKALRKQMS